MLSVGELEHPFIGWREARLVVGLFHGFVFQALHPLERKLFIDL